MRGRLVPWCVVAAVVAATASPVVAAPPAPSPPTADYLVVFRDEAARDAAPLDADTVSDTFDAVPAVTATLDATEAAALEAHPDVVLVEPDLPVTITGASTITAPSWGLDRIDEPTRPLDGLYVAPADGGGVPVYVFDNGIGPIGLFGDRLLPGYDVVDGDTDGRTTCGDGHGTAVAGTIGASDDPATPARSEDLGVARGVTIVPVRIISCTNTASVSDVVAGVDWVIAQHTAGEPAVINMSLATVGGPSTVLNDAVQAAVDDGIVVVVAAGNAGTNACSTSPASAPAALTVAASTSADARWTSANGSSNTGPCVDLFAPGALIPFPLKVGSVWSASTLAVWTGTSLAAPHVAGVAAQLLWLDPTLTPAEVTQLVTAGAVTGVISNAGTGTPNRLLQTVSVAPPNDAFAAAQVLPADRDVTWEQWTRGATREPAEPVHDGVDDVRSVWFRFTPTFAGSMTLDTVGSGFDTVVAVYTGSVVGALTPVVSDDGGGGAEPAAVSFAFLPGVTYQVAVGGRLGGEGYLLLSSRLHVAANDAFTDAIELDPTRPSRVLTHTFAATGETGEPWHAQSGAFRSLWWRLTAPTTGRLFVSSHGSDFDTVLGLYRGDAVDALTEVASNDDALAQSPAHPAVTTSQVIPPVDASTFHVAVDGYGGGPSEGWSGPVTFDTAFVADGRTAWVPAPTPLRLVDTRPDPVTEVGLIAPDETLPLNNREVRRYVAAGVGGIPAIGEVAALTVNVTAVQAMANGNVAVYPCTSIETPPPATSTVNFLMGTAVSNNMVVGLADGGFCVRTSARIHVIVDATGWYTDTTTFVPLDVPARLYDSRPISDDDPLRQGLLEAPDDATVALAPFEVRRLVLTEVGGLPAPADMAGIALNVTTVGTAGNGFLKVWACASTSPVPTASTLNYSVGGARANGLIAAVDLSGGLCLQSSATAHVIVDATGWVTTSSTVIAWPTPSRAVDTRPGFGGALERGVDITAPLVADTTVRFVLGGPAGLPTGGVALAALVNLTAVQPAANGNLKAWACASADDPVPATSVLNMRPGMAVANGGIVAVGGADAGVCVRASQPVHLVIDVVGWQVAAPS